MGHAVLTPFSDTTLSRLELAASAEDLQSIIETLRDQFGVDHIVYHWVNSNGEQYGVGTYSEEWVSRYLQENYLRIDPVVQGCSQRFHPTDWKQLDWSSKAARSFYRDAVEHGIGNQGFSIPIRGPNGQFALFTLSHNCSDTEWSDFTEQYRRDLILIAHFFNQSALTLEPDRQPEAVPNLSPRETDVLTLLATGHSRSQVANTLQISEHTLRAYIESARFKLRALNTTHAVARALHRGLIVI